MSKSFSFVVPNGVSYVRAVVVGGGGGGTNLHQPGGGGGYVNCSIVSVTTGQSIGVIVSAGGTGAATSNVSTIIVGTHSGPFGPGHTGALSGRTSSPVAAAPVEYQQRINMDAPV